MGGHINNGIFLSSCTSILLDFWYVVGDMILLLKLQRYFLLQLVIGWLSLFAKMLGLYGTRQKKQKPQPCKGTLSYPSRRLEWHHIGSLKSHAKPFKFKVKFWTSEAFLTDPTNIHRKVINVHVIACCYILGAIRLALIVWPPKYNNTQ